MTFLCIMLLLAIRKYYRMAETEIDLLIAQEASSSRSGFSLSEASFFGLQIVPSHSALTWSFLMSTHTCILIFPSYS